MKSLLRIAVLLLAIGSAAETMGADARITQISKEVRLLRPGSAPRKATINDQVANQTSVQTGSGGQTELRFGNGTLVRLGANSLLHLSEGSRRMELSRGALLVRAPKAAGPVEIETGNTTSAVAGTTSILECYPRAYTKLIALEGTARIFMPQVVGESVLVNAGQLLMFHTAPAPTALPNPVDIDLKRLVATSQLIKGFAPLGSESSIAQGMQDQNKRKSEGALAETNLVIFGRGTLVSLVPPDAKQNKAAPSPSPTPKAKGAERAH